MRAGEGPLAARAARRSHPYLACAAGCPTPQGDPTVFLLSLASVTIPLCFASVKIGTCMRLNLFVGSAKGCLGSTCISLCGWSALTLSLSLSPLPQHVQHRQRAQAMLLSVSSYKTRRSAKTSNLARLLIH